VSQNVRANCSDPSALSGKGNESTHSLFMSRVGINLAGTSQQGRSNAPTEHEDILDRTAEVASAIACQPAEIASVIAFHASDHARGANAPVHSGV
jgi:hypothetical protein